MSQGNHKRHEKFPRCTRRVELTFYLAPIAKLFSDQTSDFSPCLHRQTALPSRYCDQNELSQLQLNMAFVNSSHLHCMHSTSAHNCRQVPMNFKIGTSHVHALYTHTGCSKSVYRRYQLQWLFIIFTHLLRRKNILRVISMDQGYIHIASCNESCEIVKQEIMCLRAWYL